MPTTVQEVFTALRAILERHAGELVVTDNTARCFRLEGGMHPTRKRPFPIAWVAVGKTYVSFHHMGVYARPDLLKGASKELKARMQGKSCFNFSAVAPALFAELEDLTVRGFDAFRNAPFMKRPGPAAVIDPTSSRPGAGPFGAPVRRTSDVRESTMPARKTDKTSKPTVRKPATRPASQRLAATTLPETMITGKASTAKAADGDKPVFAYIDSLPQPQRGIAERVDALAARTLPGLQRSVKWGMSYYGVGDGWCFCCGGFATHVKLMFVNGATLTPVPPVTPAAMGKSTRGVELESVDDLDERQIAAWMRQVAAKPGVGRKKR